MECDAAHGRNLGCGSVALCRPQMATGVAHLHGLRIVHRDIKVRASDGRCGPGSKAGPVMSFIKHRV